MVAGLELHEWKILRNAVDRSDGLDERFGHSHKVSLMCVMLGVFRAVLHREMGQGQQADVVVQKVCTLVTRDDDDSYRKPIRLLLRAVQHVQTDLSAGKTTGGEALYRLLRLAHMGPRQVFDEQILLPMTEDC